jgi:hypothetical protein
MGIERTLEGIKRMITFDVTEIPQIEEWEDGRDYTITMKIHQVSKTTHEEMPTMAMFEVVDIEVGDMEKEERSLAGTAPFISLGGGLGGQDK